MSLWWLVFVVLALPAAAARQQASLDEIVTEHQAPLRALLIAGGTLGDTMPLISVGTWLVRAGWRVTMVAGPEAHNLSEAAGFRAVDFRRSFKKIMQEEVELIKAFQTGSSAETLAVLAPFLTEGDHHGCLVMRGLLDRGSFDVVVSTSLENNNAAVLAAAFRLPFVSLALQHTLPSGHLPVLLFGDDGLDEQRTYQQRFEAHVALRRGIYASIEPSIRAMSAAVAGAVFPPLDAWLAPIVQGEGPLQRTALLYSPLISPLQPDYPEGTQILGAAEPPHSSDSETVPTALQTWLAAGQPPVYVGWGSMSIGDERSPQLVEVVVRALQQTGRRGVLFSGWQRLSTALLDDAELVAYAGANVFEVHDDVVSQSWLFPRCAALVIHGGAGTTAAALRSGRPIVVSPLLADQPWHAGRVEALGVGVRVSSMRTLTAAELAAAIDTVTGDQRIVATAADVGRRARRENGALHAAQLLASLARHHRAHPGRQLLRPFVRSVDARVRMLPLLRVALVGGGAAHRLPALLALAARLADYAVNVTLLLHTDELQHHRVQSLSNVSLVQLAGAAPVHADRYADFATPASADGASALLRLVEALQPDVVVTAGGHFLDVYQTTGRTGVPVVLFANAAWYARPLRGLFDAPPPPVQRFWQTVVHNQMPNVYVVQSVSPALLPAVPDLIVAGSLDDSQQEDDNDDDDDDDDVEATVCIDSEPFADALAADGAWLAAVERALAGQASVRVVDEAAAQRCATVVTTGLSSRVEAFLRRGSALLVAARDERPAEVWWANLLVRLGAGIRLAVTTSGLPVVDELVAAVQLQALLPEHAERTRRTAAAVQLHAGGEEAARMVIAVGNRFGRDVVDPAYALEPAPLPPRVLFPLRNAAADEPRSAAASGVLRQMYSALQAAGCEVNFASAAGGAARLAAERTDDDDDVQFARMLNVTSVLSMVVDGEGYDAVVFVESAWPQARRLAARVQERGGLVAGIGDGALEVAPDDEHDNDESHLPGGQPRLGSTSADSIRCEDNNNKPRCVCSDPLLAGQFAETVGQLVHLRWNRK